MNASGNNFTEIRAMLHNRSAWPARAVSNISFRYYVDLSEVIKAGYKRSDIKITLNYHQGATVSPLQVSD